ncbi:MAG TPA: hypothetical protein ENJ24_02665 [Gammaproteobacteria bacterium]|nr:hypothetical protein [Gammaproteobacteria bacterium]
MNRILRIAPAIIAGMILFVTAMDYSTAQEPKGSIKEAVHQEKVRDDLECYFVDYKNALLSLACARNDNGPGAMYDLRLKVPPDAEILEPGGTRISRHELDQAVVAGRLEKDSKVRIWATGNMLYRMNIVTYSAARMESGANGREAEFNARLEQVVKRYGASRVVKIKMKINRIISGDGGVVEGIQATLEEPFGLSVAGAAYNIMTGGGLIQVPGEIKAGTTAVVYFIVQRSGFRGREKFYTPIAIRAQK